MVDKNDKENTDKPKGSAPQPPKPAKDPVKKPESLPTNWNTKARKPGTMAEATEIINSRVIDTSKIYSGPVHPDFASYPEGSPSIVEQARALKNDPQLIFEFVYANIDWQPAWGEMKGPLGCLMDQSGGAWDQCSLLVALLTQAGYSAEFVLGQIKLTTAQYDAWFNTDSQTVPNCCYDYAQSAQIPGDAPVESDDVWTMIMSHVWVSVVVNETTYVLDPSYKTYNRPTTVAVGGSATTGDALHVTVYDAGLGGGSTEVSYTVLVTDTLGSIATALSSAINSDTSLSAIGVTSFGSTSPAQLTISSRSAHATTYATSTSGGATETLTITSPVSGLATILGYNSSDFLTSAESGATIDGSGNFVQNMNTANIRTGTYGLQSMAESLITWIGTNNPTASIDQILGGQTIVPITLPFTWETSLAYEYSITDTYSSVPTGYRTTLQVQYFQVSEGVWDINQTFYSDQLAGGRLTLTFNSGSYPVLTLNGTVVQTGTTAQTGANDPNSGLLTVTHNAYTGTFPQYTQSNIYAGQYYLIANAWGNLGSGQLAFHQTQLAAALANSSSTNEAVNGEWMSNVWFNWASQYSRVADLLGRINNTYMISYHQVGVVSFVYSGDNPAVGTDLQGIADYVVTLNADTTTPPITATLTGTHGVALEATVCSQFNGVEPGISTTTLIDKANSTAVITIGGTATAGDVVEITVHDPALSGGSESDSYLVLSGDTPSSIAAGLVSALHADTSLQAIGLYALQLGAKILIGSTADYQTTYTGSVTGSETETISIVWSKIYNANTSNWTTGINVYTILNDNGYSTGTLSDIGAYASTTGEYVVIGDQPTYVLGGWGETSQWAGYGYWVFFEETDTGGALGVVQGNLAGGGGQAGPGKEPTQCPPEDDPSKQPTGGEPIGFFSGDFFYSRTDITIGSQSYPYSLPFTRSYDSANQYFKGTMGWGWTHNHAITATVGSDGLLAMGSQFAAQAASTIAELYVSVDLASDLTQPIAKLVTMTLADKWWIDQLVNNTVAVSFANASQVFVQQPGGTYTAPSDFPSTLTLSSGLYKLTTPQLIAMNFNSSGQISTIVNPNGVTVTYTYSGGVLSTVSNGMDRTLTLNYTSGQLTSVTDGTGRSVGYSYDGSHDLTTFTDTLSNEITYQYDQPGRMTKYFLPAHPSTAFVTNVYDSLSRVETQANARGQVTTCYFAGSRSEMDDPLGNAQVLYFNSLGSVTRSINALGFETDTVYDGLSRAIQITLPEGNQILLTYDGNNNILTKTFVPKPGSGLSNVQRVYTYNATWAKVATAQDANGNITTYSYDPTQGNLTSTVGPTLTAGSPQVVMTYNGRGQMITQEVYTTNDSTFIETQFNYDGTTEKMTSVVVDYGSGGHLNLTTSYGYDSVGNCSSLTDPNSNETAFVSDSERRRTQMTAPSPFSYLTNWGYDANSNLTSFERQVTGTPTYQTTSYAYSVTNQLYTSTDPLLLVTTSAYDGADRLESVLDPQGREWQYAYDQLNRIYKVTDPTNTVCDTRSYTDNGYLESREDANTNVTQYAYDGLDRLSTTTFADATTQKNSSYDANGNVLTYLPRYGAGYSTTMTYDALNRLATKSPYGQAEITYTYDLSSRTIELNKAGSGDPSCGNFQFFYDTAGRFTEEEYPDSKTVTHVLDNNGNRTKTTWPDGYYVTRSFDQLNRLTNIYLNGSGSSSAAFAYDQLSRRSSLTLGNGVVIDYTYSLDNDLTELEQTFVGSSNTYNFEYNNVHQVTGASVTNSAYMWQPSVGSTTYGTADDVNKYPTVGTATFTYDGNKNLTYDGTYTYSYDIENHLLTVYEGATSISSYVYDPLQRQAQKTVGAASTRFIYSGTQEIADYIASSLNNRYIFAGGNEPLIQVTSGGTVSYMHRDNQTSVVATTNSSGDVTNNYTYSPFGQSAAISGTTFGYTGQRYDAETGLYYFKRRYYSPVIGRFLQTDPIGYAGEGLNLYTYALNDPMNRRDPSGLAPTASSSNGPGLLSLLSPPGGCENVVDQGSGGAGSGSGGTGWNPTPWLVPGGASAPLFGDGGVFDANTVTPTDPLGAGPTGTIGSGGSTNDPGLPAGGSTGRSGTGGSDSGGSGNPNPYGPNSTLPPWAPYQVPWGEYSGTNAPPGTNATGYSSTSTSSDSGDTGDMSEPINTGREAAETARTNAENSQNQPSPGVIPTIK